MPDLMPPIPTDTSPLVITAYARAGALTHAWALFVAAGLDRVTGDAAVLALHGRLRKDRAIAATGAERRTEAAAAADCYAAAAAIAPASYPLINAATLALIGGDPQRAAALAEAVLAGLDSGEAPPDTPYWDAATRAEALLLTGRRGDAEAALDIAIAAAPEAWEDHACTLKQLGVILAEQRAEATWLDRFRPPCRLHFTGSLDLGDGEAAVAAAVDRLLAAERVGAGHGALAAGADIVIAERLLAAGAELHAVLPGGRDAFVAASVEPFGQGWRSRFEAVAAAATSIRAVGTSVSPLVLELGDLLAMGGAALHAQTLQTRAVQLIVGGGATSGRASDLWRRRGRRQLTIDISPRADAMIPMAEVAGVDIGALLGLAFGAPDAALPDAALASAIAALAGVLGTGMIAPPGWTTDGVLLAFARPEEAVQAARHLSTALRDVAAVRLAGHFGQYVSAATADGRGAAAGSAARTTLHILAVTPPGAFYMSEDFAAVLCAADAAPPATGFIGELPGNELLPLRAFEASLG